MPVRRGPRRLLRLDQPVARFLRAAGYIKVPNKRQYVSPSGAVVSRRQAEQQSGALGAIYGVRSREELTRTAPTRAAGRRHKMDDFAREWKACHNDPRGIARIKRDPDFIAGVAYFRNLTIPWRDRRRFMENNFCWIWIEREHNWRYHS